jgi:chromosome segregation ATPase
MTRSEYQELVEFLGKKFDAIDRRFEAIDRRFDAIDRRFDALEGRVTRVEVTQEQDRDLIQAVAEGVASLSERLDRFQEEVSSEFRAIRSEMSAGFTSVWAEFGTVRSEMSAGFTSVREEMSLGFSEQRELIERLDGRVGRLEARLN